MAWPLPLLANLLATGAVLGLALYDLRPGTPTRLFGWTEREPAA